MCRGGRRATGREEAEDEKGAEIWELNLAARIAGRPATSSACPLGAAGCVRAPLEQPDTPCGFSGGAPKFIGFSPPVSGPPPLNKRAFRRAVCVCVRCVIMCARARRPITGGGLFGRGGGFRSPTQPLPDRAPLWGEPLPACGGSALALVEREGESIGGCCGWRWCGPQLGIASPAT